MASTNTPPIEFHFLVPFPLRQRRKLKTFIFSIFRSEKTRLENLHYIFCSDDYLLNINRQFLNHDFYTDIITFNLASKNEPISAEIYISVDRVKDNARSLNLSAHQELLRVMFHGVLHLCGHKDKTRDQIRLMRQKEDFYLRKFERMK